MMMKEKVGEVFSIAMDNPAIPGCTISKAVHDGANDIICFSLARNTDISAEIYPYHKLIIMAEGVIEIYGADGFRRNLHTSESIITLTDTPMGIRTAEGAVYTEVSIRRSDIMNEAIKAGEVFRLAEIVPYQDGKIVNMDVVHNDKMKFVIMDEPTKGVDVGAKAEIYAIMGDLAKKGYAIILISSEMPEILGMSDRIVVMCNGRKTGELGRGEATQEMILELAMEKGTTGKGAAK